MRIDLKAMLLISTSAPPDSVIRLNKRFQVGKASYMVRYELHKGELIIRHMKKVHRNPTLASSIRKRQRKLQTESTRSDSLSQTSLLHDFIAVDNASQTARRECCSVQVDTSDLMQTYSRDQQTINFEIQSAGSQTEKAALQSRITQTKIISKSCSTEASVPSASMSSQTETVCTNAGVQSKMEGQDENIQTDEVEEQLIKPYLQGLIRDSVKDMRDLIHHEVMDAVSQVLDTSTLVVRKTQQEQDMPREGALEPLTPLPVDQIGDNLPLDKFLTVGDIRNLFSKSAFKSRVTKTKKFSAGHSWNCTMKCKSCGLHMHRSRLALPLDSQSTQAKEEEREQKEQTKAKVSAEMGTQTEKLEKERGRWTLKRS